MDDRRALMAAIIANPDEDTPRLALADWLQEHGDEHDRARAEFIRLQIQSVGADKKGARPLTERANALYQEHKRHWLGLLWGLDGTDDHEFNRGILDWWYTSAGNFLKRHCQEAACERFPLLGVGRLALRDNTKRVKAVADSPALEWVVSFQWYDSKIADDGFAALAASPHTGRLSKLWIDKPRCSDTGLKSLAKSKCYPNLRTFGLYDGLWRGKFTAAGVSAVLESKYFPRLEELELSGAHTHTITGPALFNCKALSRLRVLRMGFDTNTTALAACPNLTNLELLSVEDSKLTDEDAHLLADNPALDRLRVLSITDLNSNRPRLGKGAEQALHDRFGNRLTLKYSILCRRD